MINITERIVGKIPKMEFNGTRGERVINWFGKYVSTPENRLIIGITALISQPFIDLYNKEVDEKTQLVSCARTIGKNVSGMLTGFGVRAGFIYLVKKYSDLGHASKGKMKKLFTPSNAPLKPDYAYKQYQNAMGMMLAIAGLVVTNFLIDAPITNFLTNILNKNFEKHNPKFKKSKEVLNEKS